KTCRSCRTCAFPGDAQRPSRLLQFSRARRVDDVLIATGNCPEKYPELRTDLAGSKAEFVYKLHISVIARQGPSDEAKLVVMLDGRHADHDVAERSLHTDTARRSCADHRLNRRPLFDQVLSLYRVLCLAVSTDREEYSKLDQE